MAYGNEPFISKAIELTAEQKAHQQREREESERQAQVERERRALAEKKADELLESCLTEIERKRYRKDRYIETWSQSGKRFRIKKGRAHNIFELDEKGREIKEYCVHVSEFVPNADNMVAQKLMIEYNEAQLHKLANVRQLVA